jgi:hypothetical protein
LMNGYAGVDQNYRVLGIKPGADLGEVSIP